MKIVELAVQIACYNCYHIGINCVCSQERETPCDDISDEHVTFASDEACLVVSESVVASAMSDTTPLTFEDTGFVEVSHLSCIDAPSAVEAVVAREYAQKNSTKGSPLGARLACNT